MKSDCARFVIQALSRDLLPRRRSRADRKGSWNSHLSGGQQRAEAEFLLKGRCSIRRIRMVRAMRKTRIGNILLAVGVAIGLLLLLPLSFHLREIRRSPIYDEAAGLTVLENCHGTPCYISRTDSILEDALIFTAPATLLLIAVGFFWAFPRE
jgi:hypothetical protein